MAVDDRFVNPVILRSGAALSLQSHVHRPGHWIVVQAAARVIVDNSVRLLTETNLFTFLGALFTEGKTQAKCQWPLSRFKLAAAWVNMISSLQGRLRAQVAICFKIS